MQATIAPPALTPAEAAYAHLASLSKGTRVAITGRRFYSEATITTPQQPYGPTIERAYVLATDRLHPEVTTRITVQSLLNGTFRIERDEPRWAGEFTDWSVDL